MAGQLVTVGTDGFTSWIAASDGKRYNLGVMSVVKLVTDLLPPRKARTALDTFLSEGSVMFVAAPNQLDSVFARAAAQNPSMRASSVKDSMATIQDKLGKIERHIQALNSAVLRKASNLDEGIGILVKMTSELKTHDVTASFEDFIKEKKEEKEEKEDKASKEASNIIEKAAATVDRIEDLASQGKRFNASKAKSDVRNITVRVASALRNSDPVAIGKLSAEMDQIHSLFFLVR